MKFLRNQIKLGVNINFRKKFFEGKFSSKRAINGNEHHSKTKSIHAKEDKEKLFEKFEKRLDKDVKDRISQKKKEKKYIILKKKIPRN